MTALNIVIHRIIELYAKKLWKKCLIIEIENVAAMANQCASKYSSIIFCVIWTE